MPRHPSVARDSSGDGGGAAEGCLGDALSSCGEVFGVIWLFFRRDSGSFLFFRDREVVENVSCRLFEETKSGNGDGFRLV